MPADAAKQHVGQDIEPRHQIELLKDHRGARTPSSEIGAFQSCHVDTVEHDPASGRLDETIDHAQQCGLARAGATDDADEPPALDLQRHVGDRRLGVEAS